MSSKSVTIVNHTKLLNIGTNTHAQIDTHIADTSDPHGATLTQSVAVESPTIRGGTAASGNLTLQSTSNITKGKLLFGTSAYDEVNNRLGIGTTAPDSLLSITSLINDVNAITLRFPSGGTTDTVGILFKGNDGTYNINYAGLIGGVENYSLDDGYIGFRTSDNAALSEKMRLTSNGTLEISGLYVGQSGVLANGLIVAGNVGIGTTIPGAQLDLSTDSARKLTTNTWATGSDKRIKRDIQTIENALVILRQIRPVKYHYIDDFLKKHPEVKNIDYYNFIAQEYAEVFPDAVSKGTDGLLYLNPSQMLPYAIAGIKEIDAKIKEQQAKIDELERKYCIKYEN